MQKVEKPNQDQVDQLFEEIGDPNPKPFESKRLRQVHETKVSSLNKTSENIGAFVKKGFNLLSEEDKKN